MAVVLAFRVAIILTPLAYRVARSGQPSVVQQTQFVGEALWNRLNDPGEDPDDLAQALSDSTGSMWTVTDYAAPFELRKAQVRWGRESGAIAGTDDAVTTHHFIKLAGGVPSDTWAEADFTAIESAMLAFWNAVDDFYTNNTSYKQVRWYRAGPSVAPPQAPVRIIDPAAAGIANDEPNGAPQVAVSVTEKTSDAKSWGRFYLPAPIPRIAATTAGRVATGFATAIADAADVMYEAFITAGTPAVVYSTAKPARQTAGGTELPARAARALGVTTVQVDDLFDVIRSRRWNEPLLRLQRAIAGA